MPHNAGLRVRAGAEGQGVQRREQGRHRDGDGEGPVEPAGDTWHDNGRHEDRQQHQRRCHYRAGDLDHRLGSRLLGAETLGINDPQGVLDHHDGVIDHDTDHQDEAEHGQSVDRQPEGEHHREGAEKRHRDGDRRHQGGSEVLQKDVDRKDHQQDGDDEGGHHLLERLHDVLGGVVEDAVLEALGEILTEAVHLGLDPVGHVEGVGAGSRVDGNGDGRRAV
jgi:hypothetical protein